VPTTKQVNSVAAIVVIGYLALVGPSFREGFIAWKSLDVAPVSGKVTKLERQDLASGKQMRYRVSYLYNVGAKEYSNAEDIDFKLSENKTVPVHYNPDNPAESMLTPAAKLDKLHKDVIFSLILCFCLFLLLLKACNERARMVTAVTESDDDHEHRHRDGDSETVQHITSEHEQSAQLNTSDQLEEQHHKFREVPSSVPFLFCAALPALKRRRTRNDDRKPIANHISLSALTQIPVGLRCYRHIRQVRRYSSATSMQRPGCKLAFVGELEFQKSAIRKNTLFNQSP
jgi:hypothetical protein